MQIRIVLEQFENLTEVEFVKTKIC